MESRKSGILLHVTSLPSDFGIGDLGKGAYEFADFLAASRQRIWQVLPLSPTTEFCGNSPYCSFSAFAGNPVLISPDFLLKDGYISREDLGSLPSFDPVRADYGWAYEFKDRLLAAAYKRFSKTGDGERGGYYDFINSNAHWLEDYALFVSLKERFSGAPWDEWPPEVRDRTQGELDRWRQALAGQIEREKFKQFLFFSQWSALKRYCNERQITVIGDMPIYVSHDSSDVWTNPQYFKLDGDKKPALVAGVPPDYFSATGQLWGNPVYNWDALAKDSYAWWIRRMEHNLRHFDIVRIDHFRGFVSFWEVPATEMTAVNGKWVEAPAREFFQALLDRFGSLAIIAEDLGILTPEVREVMKKFKFPGMKVLLFAFGGDTASNPYAPHNHVRNCIVYTGTHDNNTAKGWFEKDANAEEKENLAAYFDCEFDEDDVCSQLVRTAMMSVASTAVVPMQDLLELGEEARMNRPSIAMGNWMWRMRADLLTTGLAERIAKMTKIYGRNMDQED